MVDNIVVVVVAVVVAVVVVVGTVLANYPTPSADSVDSNAFV